MWIWRSNFPHREIQTHLEAAFAAWSLLLFPDLTSSSSGFLVSCGSGVSRLGRPGVSSSVVIFSALCRSLSVFGRSYFGDGDGVSKVV